MHIDSMMESLESHDMKRKESRPKRDTITAEFGGKSNASGKS